MDTRTREELIAENALLKEKLAALEAEVEMLRDKLSGGGNGSSAAPFIKPSRQQRREAERAERKKRKQLKDELGLDHFEGRSYNGWHHHVTLTMIAFGFLVMEGFRVKKTIGWTLPRAKRELQKILLIRLGFCPTCGRPVAIDDN